MMNSLLLNILLHALAAAPHMVEHLGAALTANWNVPHVQQARQGVAVLSQLLSDLDPAKVANGEVAKPVSSVVGL